MHKKLYLIYIFAVIIITNCVYVPISQLKDKNILSYWNQQHMCFNQKKRSNLSEIYDKHIFYCSKIYDVDALLVKAIIQVESNYNPIVVSKSNAIGLMQIKADAAGQDAYRLKGWTGKPSTLDLKNAIINIELGTAYLSILQNQLKSVTDIETRRYAIIVAYVNGLGALLKIFSSDKLYAIEKINTFSAKQFYEYIQSFHPSDQARRYLSKVNAIYILQQ